MYELTDRETAAHLERAAKIDAMLEEMPRENPFRFALFRTKGIGGSDAQKLFFIHGSPRSLFLEKSLRVPFKEPNIAMRMGTLCESLVADVYAEKTGYAISKARSMTSEQYVYLSANFDRLVLDEAGNVIGGLECKTCGHNTSVRDPKTGETRLRWGTPNEYDADKRLIKCSSEIDPQYVPQVQFYLLVSGLPWWDVAVIISNTEHRVYRVFPDIDFQQELLRRAHEFWLQVLNDTEPPAVFADLTAPMSDDISQAATPEQITVCRQIRGLDEQIKELELRKTSLQDELAQTLTQASRLTFTNEEGKEKTLLTFRSGSSSRFNAAKFRLEHPDLYEQYTEKTETKRVFRLASNF